MGKPNYSKMDVPFGTKPSLRFGFVSSSSGGNDYHIFGLSAHGLSYSKYRLNFLQMVELSYFPSIFGIMLDHHYYLLTS